jgi:hypothetical protein
MPPTLPNLSAGALVRVEDRSGQRIEGRVEHYRADSLVIHRGELARVGIPLGSLSRIWVRERATKTGMLVGGLLGVPLGALAGGGLCDFERNQENNIGEDVSCTEHYIGATVAGAALGVGLGALVGRAIPKWNLRFHVAP